jgi:replicative DNA helicase
MPRTSKSTPLTLSLQAPSPLARVMRRVDDAADGAPSPDSIPTGFPSLDRMLGGGIRRGDLVVLGGDVGSGKSALALAIALRSAQDGRVAALLSGEMSVERITERALAIEGRARIDDIRRGTLDDAARAGVGAAAVRLRDGAPLIDLLPAGGAAATVEALRRTLDLELALIDSLQSLGAGARAQDEELADAMRLLKRAAMELNIGVILSAHVPLLPPDRPDRRPTLDDFGAMGAVKQHADVVLALYREEMYHAGHGTEGATELLVRKNRNGATGYVDLYFYKQWMRFEDMLDPDR